MTTSEKLIGVVLFGVLIVVGLSQLQGGGQSEATRALGDSLTVTRPAFVDSTRAHAQRETVYVALADKQATRAALAAGRAEGLQRAADSLATLVAVATTATDSITALVRAYGTRTEEADTLRLAYRRADSAFASERSARLEADARADANAGRLAATERLNVSLTTDLAKATRKRWLNRLAIGPGYGLYGADGTFRHGPTLAVVWRVN